jgi:preprotein translocase subunit SecG
MGAAFGSGASGSLFGASGSSNFLSKLTGIAAAVFFISTLALSFFGSRPAVSSGGVMEQAPVNSPQSQSGSVTAPTSLPAKPVGQAGEIPK